MTTKFRTHYMAMGRDDRERYARAAGTTDLYIRTHLVGMPPRKTPQPRLMRGLAEASDGALTLEDVLAHFYATDKDAAA